MKLKIIKLVSIFRKKVSRSIQSIYFTIQERWSWNATQAFTVKCSNSSVAFSGWVHTVPLTTLFVFVDLCQTLTLLHFCTKIQIKYPFLWAHVAHRNGGINIRFCGFNPFTMLWSRQISAFMRSHLSTAVEANLHFCIQSEGRFVKLCSCACLHITKTET